MKTPVFESIAFQDENISRYLLLLNEKVTNAPASTGKDVSMVCNILCRHQDNIWSVCDSLMLYCGEVIALCQSGKQKFPQSAFLFTYLLRHSGDILSFCECLYEHCRDISAMCKYLADSKAGNDAEQTCKRVLDYCLYVSLACNQAIRYCNRVIFVVRKLPERKYEAAYSAKAVRIIRDVSICIVSEREELMKCLTLPFPVRK